MAVRLSLALALLALLPASAPRSCTCPRPRGRSPATRPTRLSRVPIEASAYDPATHCSPKRAPGMLALQHWLEANVRGVFWGSYRCEKWGKKSASLHAENRAIDWHLDVDVPADRRAAERLIRLLLAPDAAGNAAGARPPHGRRGADLGLRVLGRGNERVHAVPPCYSKRGKLRKHVDPTVATATTSTSA